jgi:2-polyprenyl-3-methyl-5-hydroxy-6-metoxy-1,4-benzoquinol methylase
MTVQVQHCPLCGSANSRFFARSSYLGQAVTNRICLACGLVYQSPRMSDSELDGFYAREYRRLYQGQEGPDPKDLFVQRSREEALLSYARPVLSGVRRHLDIGCSAGLLLQRFQAEYGSQPVGVEPGIAYRAYAHKQGLQVYDSLAALRAASEDRFDLISLAHVLEHLADPVGYLIDLRAGELAPDGRLLVEVPNLYAHDSFEIAHLVSYSPHTLVQTLLKAGYTIEALYRHGQPRSKVIPLYITALARPDGLRPPEEIAPEKGVEFKRRMGMLQRSLLTRLMPRSAWVPLPKGTA